MVERVPARICYLSINLISIHKEHMPGYCFAPGCDSGYASARRRNKMLGKKNPSLFYAPKDSLLLRKWQTAIRRKDKMFNITDKLCELHFEDECIDRVHETKLFDGSIFTIDREKPRLKPGSVPTRFPILPKYLSTKTSKRKNPVLRNTKPNKKKRLKVNVDNDNNIRTNSQQQPNDCAEFLHHLKDIQVPNSWWSIKLTPEYVMYAKWNSEFSCERRVVVCKDFSVKVFLKEMEINITDFMDITCIEDISNLLERVESYKS